MSAGRIIAYIIAAILIFFGVIFTWGAFSPQGQVGWILIGLISVGIGFGVIWFASRHLGTSAGAGDQNVTLKIDLPADVNLDTLDQLSLIWIDTSRQVRRKHPGF